VRGLKASLFKEQLDFIEDPAKLKAAKCTRRSGKSYGAAGIYMAITCIENPGCNCLYLATTRDSAKKIILKDILKVIR
jgi:phage FluMu gp28-like protein